MPFYRVFGGVLESEIAFDGMHPVAPSAATWRFSISRGQDEWGAALEIGRERVSSDLEIVLARTEDGGTLVRYSAYDLGTFHISPGGADIRWKPGPEPWMAPLRWVLMGRVMATAMYVGGTLCLHGSAVLVDDGAVCFIAPKHHGKSTLAAAMVSAGSALVADDVLPVHPGEQVTISPGVPVLRLHEDSGRATALTETRDAGEDVSGKTRIDFDPVDATEPRRHRLAAIYTLRPVPPEESGGLAVSRERISGLQALRALVEHTSIASLLSAAEGRLLMTHASAVVRSVEIYELRVVRDLERLPEVVRQLRSWHAGRLVSQRF